MAGPESVSERQKARPFAACAEFRVWRSRLRRGSGTPRPDGRLAKPKRVDGNYYNPVYKDEPGSTWPVYGLGCSRDGKPNAQIHTTSGPYQLWGSGTAMANATWVHVAVTYDTGIGNNNFRVYQNGLLVNQGNASGALKTGTGPLHIGGNYCEWNQDVTIEELRIWNKALSGSEIQTVMAKTVTARMI